MSKFSILTLFLLFLFCFNDDEDCTPAPGNCIEKEPSSGTVTITISPEYCDEHSRLTFYEKSVETGDVIMTRTQTSAVASYQLPTGKIAVTINYSATINNTVVTITSIDADKLEARSEEYCYTSCYEPAELDIDLTLDESLLE